MGRPAGRGMPMGPQGSAPAGEWGTGERSGSPVHTDRHTRGVACSGDLNCL